MHRKSAVFGWLVLVIAAVAAGQGLGTKSLPSYDPGQAGQAERTLQQLTGNAFSPPAEDVLIQARAPGATFAADPAMRQAVREVAAALAAVPKAAAGMRSPLDPAGKALVSADGRSVLVTFAVPGNPDDEDQAVLPAIKAVARVQASHPDLVIREAGDASIDRAVNDSLNSDFRRAEATSVPVTLVLLLFVFGALIAAGIPVLLAVTAVTTAISLLAIPSRWLPVGAATSEAVLLIGMAVGVDYSLFYLRREREERSKGRTFAEALRIAAGTSGRSIVVSGLTVMAAMAGLFLTGLAVFTGVALGTIAVVGIAVAGSLTVLPALLSWLGRRADRGRVPFLGRRRAAARPSRVWAALAQRVVRHPLAWGFAAVIALLALASPALGMRLGYPAIVAPKNLPAVTTMDTIQRAFPQSPSPAEVVVTGPNLTGTAVRDAIAALRRRAAAGGPIREPVTATAIAGGRALTITVPLAGSGVFILSRIRELRAGGASTKDAFTGGISSSAGVVTSAALIMVAVFSIFATLSLIDLKILGIGLAAAVLIDATLIRGILLPAALSLLGEHSWYLPRWLRWLPGASPCQH